MPSRSARVRAVAAGLALVATLAGCPDRSARPVADPAGPSVGPGAGTAAASFAPGAAGVGDPYFPSYGNGGYDVANYRLAVRYDPDSKRLSGTATITATATAALSRFNLDLVGLTVESATVDGAPATTARDGAELTVTPAAGLARGARFTARIRYSGIPRPVHSPQLGDNGFLSTADGAIALGEPESASTWFPVNDHPQDKATYDIEVTVPADLVALSNGVPGGTVAAGAGWTTWRWSERSPMASYLCTLVIGRYRIERSEHGGKPMVLAVPSNLPSNGPAARSLAATGTIVDYLTSQFGPYPFDSYGGIVVRDKRIRYALETQSRPVYGEVFFDRGVNEGVIAHELAHQWFGDSVSLSRWSDMWLNEGFATYAEWLWAEHTGERRVQESFDTQYARTLWSKPALDPGRADLFGMGVYQRGALVVHALRMTVGDEKFFAILRAWTTERRDGNGTTADFQALAERISGRQLDRFFADWLTGTAAPPIPG
ncbi:M1 family metallopeptidase [Plantactinospora sp. KBS50]|uniref:M1 family metallopeptidase n=1 Tax=Plantactinospora sp. KBS50 TaxID=2024580 RepID=UPI000BAADA95|nr:M1 family metallopeptidase [Plantactinospora sp. KBS50]ASW53618.1 peptidase M1 [Plantactinospora sp. KBS50]